MEPLTLAEATLQDIDRIMDMEADGFSAGNRELRDVYARRITTFPQGSLMACAGPECVGCIFAEIWRMSPLPAVEDFMLGHDIRDRHDPAAGTELYITSMTIGPAFRGRGLGAPLLLGGINHVAAAFPQLTSALLLVSESWHAARRIYAAAGFREVVRFGRFFNPAGTMPEDGLVMRRPLEGERRGTISRARG